MEHTKTRKPGVPPSISRRTFGVGSGAFLVTAGLGGLVGRAYSTESSGEPTGFMTIAMPDEPPDLGLDHVPGTYGHSLRNIGEALVQRDPETMELKPELALSWENIDPLTWRFKLRQGVLFHDGSPFDAEAAAYSLNYMWDRDNGLNTLSRAGPPLHVTALEDDLIEVVLDAPDPILPARMYYCPIPSMEQLKNRVQEYKTHPVGTGPYRFVSFSSAQSLRMTANPDWWGANSPDALGRISIKDLEFVMRTRDIVRASMVSADEAQLGRWVLEDQCSPGCKVEPSLTMILLRNDCTHVAMKDRRVREAIGLAVDRGTLMDQILGGGELRDQAVGPATFGFNPDLEPFTYDPARAKELLAEAKADGVPIEAPLRIVSRVGPVPNVHEAVEAVAFYLREVGLNASSSVLESAAFDTSIKEKPVPPERGMIHLWVHTQGLFDYGGTVDQYFTSTGGNTGVFDPRLDAMYDEAAPLVGEARLNALQEIAQYIRDQVYYVPIGQPDKYHAASDQLEWEPRTDGLLLAKEMNL